MPGSYPAYFMSSSCIPKVNGHNNSKHALSTLSCVSSIKGPKNAVTVPRRNHSSCHSFINKL